MIKRRLVWLACAALLFGGFAVLAGSRDIMNAVADAALEVKRALALICSPARYSVGEAVVCLAAVLALVFIVCSAVRLIRSRGERLRVLASRGLLALDVILTVCVILSFTLGASYRADGFTEKSGLAPRGGTVSELYALTEDFTARVNALAGSVPRGVDGTMSLSADEIIDRAAGLFAEAEKEFPCLAGPELRVKKLRLSRVMSALGYTGVYIPFTGEANVNVDFPAALLPDTVAHELAHQRGAASENEANFAAIAACLTCGDDVYAYSGALSAWTYLGNALYKYDREAYSALYRSLDPRVQADILASNAYWAQFESPVSQVSGAVYDSFLKGYGETDGIRSYGEVVGLLLAYYA